MEICLLSLVFCDLVQYSVTLFTVSTPFKDLDVVLVSLVSCYFHAEGHLPPHCDSSLPRATPAGSGHSSSPRSLSQDTQRISPSVHRRNSFRAPTVQDTLLNFEEFAVQEANFKQIIFPMIQKSHF